MCKSDFRWEKKKPPLGPWSENLKQYLRKMKTFLNMDCKSDASMFTSCDFLVVWLNDQCIFLYVQWLVIVEWLVKISKPLNIYIYIFKLINTYTLFSKPFNIKLITQSDEFGSQALFCRIKEKERNYSRHHWYLLISLMKCLHLTQISRKLFNFTSGRVCVDNANTFLKQELSKKQIM